MMNRVSCALSIFFLVAASASAQVPAGGEFQLNTWTFGRQVPTFPAMEPDGDFVVVWTTPQGQDGSGDGVFGQRFDATGARRGNEFRVNAYTTGDQGAPNVAVGKDGDFVVVWTTFDAAQGAWNVHGQRFATSGAPAGAEFPVNMSLLTIQPGPHVGRASDGGFVVTWDTNADAPYGGNGVAARRFDPSGNPIGGEFVANTYTPGTQRGNGVAVGRNGDFVVVWEGLGADGSSFGVVGQRFDAAGNRLGSEFLVNSYTTNFQGGPMVSVSPLGGFVVAWFGFGDGNQWGALARRFDAAGSPLGSDFVVNTYTTGDQFAGGITHDDLGNFVIGWGDSFGTGAFAQRFTASGARRGPEFQVNTYLTGTQTVPSVASDAVGNFVVTWAHLDGSDWGPFGRRFGGLGPAALVVDASGNRVLEPGETVEVKPSWRNVNGAAQTFGGTMTNMTGPAGAVYTITDGAANYGTVADGATAPCADCYGLSVSNPATRPAVHWDAAAVEGITPDSQGQQKKWLLHVGRSFTDVPASNGFYRFIETLLHHGVTGGCTATAYCPSTATTRDQMAVFVLVAKEGSGYVPPACGTPVFADVPASSPFCRWIEELARRGVASGCGAGMYCPTAAVTREQMAVFVLRTLDPALSPAACTTPIYNDVPATSGFCRWIEELTRRSVVSGCGGGNYCPAAAVTRDQMGVFLGVTFGLTLYGP